MDRDDDDEDRRAHERANDPANGAGTSTDETTAIATASTSMDAAAPHHVPNTPLEGERSGQESTGEVGARTEVGEGEDGGEKSLPDESSKRTEPASPPDEAKATRDQGLQPATSASARSASHNHPTGDAEMTDPPQLSKDPGDATGDDARCPDAPTEPPDKPEGTGGQKAETRVETRACIRCIRCTDSDGNKTCRPGQPDEPLDDTEGARVEEAEMSMLKAPRVVQESPDVDGDKERRPGWPDEPPDKPYGAPRNPDSVQVEPGGETEAKRDGSAAHECADAAADGRAEEAHGDVQDKAERSATC